MNIPRRGTPLVVSAPSGAGKTTLCHRVVQRLDDIVFSISHTTRPPRGGEVAGIDYHFVTDGEFVDMAAQGDFLEHAHVHGHRYGTGRAAAHAHLAAGRDVLFDIDLQGGAQIARALPDAVLVFIMPPSLHVLAERLRARGTDSEAQIAQRLGAADQEIRAASAYTHYIVNEDLDEATTALESIVRAERLRHTHWPQLQNMVLGTSHGQARS